MKRFSATHKATGLQIRVSDDGWLMLDGHFYGDWHKQESLPGFIRYLESTAKKLRKLTKEKK